MTQFSSNQIKNLGKRLRDGTASSADFEMLDAFRCEFDHLLIEVAQNINEILHKNHIQHLLSGRTKRTKSIIRKLIRSENAGMDLSRMADIVGIRIVLANIEDQEKAFKLLTEQLPMIQDPHDYRDRDKGYRAIHLITGTTARRIEIQLRTCAQHLWADSTERLGEQAKEGITTGDETIYLEKLFKFTSSIDANKLSPNDEESKGFLVSYEQLTSRFKRVTAIDPKTESSSFVVVYHVATNTLIRFDAFSKTERKDALEHFRLATKSLSENEYDILVLNTGVKEALAVTHPRYFPESI